MSLKAYKTVKDELVSCLKSLGLSTDESRVFIALTSHPKLSATELCRETGIPDSKIYYALDGLLRKGMIIVQRGRPNLYKALPPDQAMENLKAMLREELEKKMELADNVTIKLLPLYESIGESGEIELAYVVKGWRNIVNKMNGLIRLSKRELTMLIPDVSILNAVKKALLRAKGRGVTINLALSSRDPRRYMDLATTLKLLQCPCCIIICDIRTLITITNWKNKERCTAIMTQDKNLVTVSREYFDNSKCCIDI